MPEANAPVLVMGAGPAGLAAAYELGRKGRSAVVFEASERVGGLSGTLLWKGYRFDIGGHRFFTRIDRVQDLWQEVLGDDFIVRPRLSRIVYGGKLYGYPLKPVEALKNLGPIEAARCVASFGRARLRPRGNETSFEEWVSNRFGDRLFEIFFRSYTEKVWGIPCEEIGADWAAQRIKNLSLSAAIKNALLGGRGAKVTSLIEEFHYPRLGPGMMYERMAEKIEGHGNAVRRQAEVVGVLRDGCSVTGLEIQHEDGSRTVEVGRHYLSSIPITVLVESMRPAAPPEVLAAARALTFRHFVVACLVVEGANLFPDTWVYVNSPELRVGRIQNQGNWSPYMVPEPDRSGISLEFFTGDGEELWSMPSADVIALARKELALSGLCRANVLDGLAIKAPRAYPVYKRGYEMHLGVVRDWLARFDNLQPMGRYGLFKYNNSDHSILTALLCVENIDGARHDVWAVNADETYHEQK